MTYIYLGEYLSYDPKLRKKEITRRIQLGWAAFGKLEIISAVHNQDCTRAMKRTMFGISLRDKVRNTEIRRRTKSRISDTVMRLKWRWAGHAARRGDDRWSRATVLYYDYVVRSRSGYRLRTSVPSADHQPDRVGSTILAHRGWFDEIGLRQGKMARERRPLPSSGSIQADHDDDEASR